MSGPEKTPGTAVEVYRHGPFTMARWREALKRSAQVAVDMGLSFGLGSVGKLPLTGVLSTDDKQKVSTAEIEELTLRPATWEDFIKADKKATDQKFEFATKSQLYKDQVDSLTDFVRNAAPGEAVFLRGDRGSGKTHVLWALRERLVAEGFCRREDIVRYPGNLISLTEQSNQPKVVMIDEFDQAFDPNDSRTESKFQQIAERFRYRLDSPIIIFAGREEELKYPEFIAEVGINLDEVHEVEIPPLTKDLFLRAMRERMAFFFDEEATTIDVEGAFDPDFLHWLIPNTSPRIATLEGALNFVSAIIQNGLFSSTLPSANFSLESYRSTNQFSGRNEFKRIYEGFSHGSQDLVNWLQRYILRRHSRQRAMEPLTVEDMMIGVLGDSDNVDMYRKKFIADLVLHRLIQSVNPNEFERLHRATEGPFLPTQRMFLFARAEQLRLSSRVQLALPAGSQPEPVVIVLSERQKLMKEKEGLLAGYNSGQTTPEEYREKVDELNKRIADLDNASEDSSEPSTE